MTEQAESVGAHVARLPHLFVGEFGHELDDQDLVVTGMDQHMRPVVHIAFRWPNSPAQDQPDTADTLQAVTTYVAAALSLADPCAVLVVVAYGPEGPARSRPLCAGLQQEVGLGAIEVHVHDGTWRTRSGRTGQWGSAHTVPSDGTPPGDRREAPPRPKPSRETLEASVAPEEAARFEPLEELRPAKAAFLGTQPPAVRAVHVLSALDAMAVDPADVPVRLALVAHVLSTDPIARDFVLSRVLEDEVHHHHVDALVRTFRAAPLAQRPQLAATCAAATFLAGRPAPVVRELLKHAQASDNLTELILTAVESGADPHTMRRRIVSAGEQRMREAERTWWAGHHSREPDPKSEQPDSGPLPQPATQPPRASDRPPGHGRAGRDAGNEPEL